MFLPPPPPSCFETLFDWTPTSLISGWVDAAAPPHRIILVEIVSHYHLYRLLLLPLSCSLFSVWICLSAYPEPQDARPTTPPPRTHERHSNPPHTHTLRFSAYFGTYHLFCHKHFLLTDCNKSLCDLKDFKQFLLGEVGNIHHLREKKKEIQNKKCFVQKYIFMRRLFVKCMNLLCKFSMQCKIKKG